MKKLFLLIALIFTLSVQAQAQTTTPNLGLVLPLAPADSWGEDINDNFTTLDALFPGGQSGHTIQNEGTSLPPRANLNMVGAGVDCANSSTTTTTCTITGGGGVGDPGTITITGDVTGSGTGSFSTTIAADSVALGTDTTGNYVSSATVNQGLLLTGTEGGSLGLIDCAAGEILKRNTTQTTWECAADATGDTAAAVAHIADTTDAHAGTAITNTPAGNIAATTAQAAINELDTEKMEATSAAVVTTFDGGACSGYLKSDGSCDDAVTAHVTLSGRDTAADSHPALYPLATDGNGDPSAAAGASALAHIYIRNDCTVNGATVPCPFLANDVGGDFYSFGIYANSYSERTSPDGTSRNAVNNQTELTLASDGVLSTEYAKRSGGSATTNFANQPNNDGLEVVSSNAGDTTQTLTCVGTTTGTGTAFFETVTLNGTTQVTFNKTDWGNIHLCVLSATALGTVTIREASANATIATISAGDLHAASAHLTWIRLVDYTPTTLADWTSSQDPGDSADALDQLANRTASMESGKVGGSTLTAGTIPRASGTNTIADGSCTDDGAGNIACGAGETGVMQLGKIGAAGANYGTAGQVLTSGGAGGSIAWAAGGSAASLHVFRPAQNEPPATGFATIDSRNSRPVLDFDAAADEAAVFSGVMNRSYSAGAVTVDIHYAMTSAITLEVIFCAQFERVGEVLDMDGDSFHTAVCSAATTVPGTTGIVDVISLAFADQAAIDGIAVGEGFRLKIYRDADAAGDDAAGDAELVWAEIRQ